MCELLKANELDGSNTKSSGGCSRHSNLAALPGAAIRQSKAQFTFQSTTYSVNTMHAPRLDKIPVCKHSPEALITQKVPPQMNCCHASSSRLTIFLMAEGNRSRKAILLVWTEPEDKAERHDT